MLSQWENWLPFSAESGINYTTTGVVVAVFILAVTPVALSARGRPWEIALPDSLVLSKLFFALSLLVVELWYLSSHIAAGLANAIISCISAFGIVAFVSTSHRRAIASSSLVSCWLLITTLSDLIGTRSALFRLDISASAARAVYAAGLKLALFVLEEVPKNDFLRDIVTGKPVAEEEVRKSRLRLLLYRAASAFWREARFIQGTLFEEDLDAVFHAEQATARFRAVWTQADKTASHCLAKSCVRATLWPCICVLISRLFVSCFVLLNPSLYAVATTTTIGKAQGDDSRGYAVGYVMFIFLGHVLSRRTSEYMNSRLLVMIRGMLTAELCEKILVLPSTQLELSGAASLMSSDMGGVATGIPTFLELWSDVIKAIAFMVEACIALYFWRQLAIYAIPLSVIPILISTVFSWMISAKAPEARVAWTDCSDKRMAAISKMVYQMRAIRMTGLEQVMSRRIHELHVAELEASKNAHFFEVITRVVAFICNAIGGTLLFAGDQGWGMFSRELSTIHVFTTWSTSSLLLSPLQSLRHLSPRFTEALASVDRLQEFLLRPNKQDQRLIGGNGQLQEEHNDRPEDCVVELRNTSIATHDNQIPILHGVNLTICRGDIVMVAGATGCGKSTLLNAIVGEAVITAGSLYVASASIAYCDQATWLKDASIRENIVFHSIFDYEWYVEVLRVCLLDIDLLQIINGDNYIVGLNGVNLSGGQRAKVALARALYSQERIIVLDNIFSMMDANTTDQIVTQLFGETGILRLSRTTVIMAGHCVYSLNVANRTVLIDDDRTVHVEVGLQNNTIRRQISNVFEQHNLLALRLYQSKQDLAIPLWIADKEAPIPEHLEDYSEAEDNADENLSYYLMLLQSVGKTSLVIWLATSLLVPSLERFPELYIAVGRHNVPNSAAFFALHLTLWAIATCFVYLTLRFWFYKIIPHSLETLHVRLMETVMRSKLGFLNGMNSTLFMRPFHTEFSIISRGLPMAFMLFLYFCGCVAVDAAVLFSVSIYSLILLPVPLLVLYALLRRYTTKLQEIRQLDLQQKAALYNHISDTINGIRHIRAFERIPQTLARGHELLNESQVPYYVSLRIQRWLEFVTGLVILSMVTTVLLASANSKTGQWATQELIAFAFYVAIDVNTTNVFSAMIDRYSLVERSLKAVAYIRNFIIDAEVEPRRRGEVPENWPSRGNIILRGVVAKYSNDVDSPTVLKHVSMNVPAGRRVGIVGRTGCGKSSLIMTILGFLEYTGQIVIDGVDLATVPQQLLRSRITTMSQDLLDFEGTVRYNLCPWLFDDAVTSVTGTMPDFETISELLWRLELWPLIQRKGGLDVQLSELALSRGQVQLLCIARGILHKLATNSKVVLIDEVASALDRRTDRHIQQLMSEMLKDCTILMIGHRSETLQHTDVILQMQDGKFVAQADPTEYLRSSQNVDGVYERPLPPDLDELVQRIARRKKRQRQRSNSRDAVRRGLRRIFRRINPETGEVEPLPRPEV